MVEFSTFEIFGVIYKVRFSSFSHKIQNISQTCYNFQEENFEFDENSKKAG